MSVDPGPPLDEIGIYQNAVATMEDLAFMNQSAELPYTPLDSWSLAQYDVYLDIVSTRVQWAIYGLQMTTDLISSTTVAFRPCFGRFFLHSHYEGRVNFEQRGAVSVYSPGAHRTSVSGVLGMNGLFNKSLTGRAGAADGLDTMLLTPDPDDLTVTNSNDSSPETIKTLYSPQLQVMPIYNGLPMTARDIFAVALSAMILGAEKGPNTACQGIRDHGLDMIPIFDTQGHSLLKYHSLIRAMRVLTRWMVAKNRFGEVDIELTRDGVVIGIGRLKKFDIGVGSL